MKGGTLGGFIQKEKGKVVDLKLPFCPPQEKCNLN